MLTHFVGILCLVLSSSADVPSRLFAVSHLKGLIQDLQHDLVKFGKNEQAELSKLETSVKNGLNVLEGSACLKIISQAHKETRKMLNMMVEGERSQLEIAGSSLGDMTLNELSKLWGALAPGGTSRVKIQDEIDNYRKTAAARIDDAEKACKTRGKVDKSNR